MTDTVTDDESRDQARRAALLLIGVAGDPSRLDDHALVDFIRRTQDLAAYAQSRAVEATALLTHRPAMQPTIQPRSSDALTPESITATELSAKLRITQRRAENLVGDSVALTSRLPGTLKALAAGDLDWDRARAVVDYTGPVADQAAADARAAGATPGQARRIAEKICARMEARIHPRSARQNITQLKRSLGRAALAVDPDAAARRCRAARKERRVWLQPADDAMAVFGARLPAEDGLHLHNTLVDRARALRRAGDPRTLEQLKVDLLVDLVTGRAFNGYTCDQIGSADAARGASPAARASSAEAPRPDASPAGSSGESFRPSTDPARSTREGTPTVKTVVHVTVGLGTLLGTDNQPGDLAGYGAIPADLARQIAADPTSTWYRLITDPITGILRHVDTTRYQPSAPLSRYVKLRDTTCQHPGCARPAVRCDLDHRNEFRADGTGGGTCACNLNPRCERHHRVKHETRWQVDRIRPTSDRPDDSHPDEHDHPDPGTPRRGELDPDARTCPDAGGLTRDDLNALDTTRAIDPHDRELVDTAPDGTLVYRSPAGHLYLVPPEPVLPVENSDLAADPDPPF